MPKLAQPLPAPGTEEFDQALLAALHSVKPADLSLERALRQGSAVLDEPISWTLLGRENNPGRILIRAGVFFTSQIAGCSCADDPTPADILNEFSEAIIEIDSDRRGFEIRYI